MLIGYPTKAAASVSFGVITARFPYNSAGIGRAGPGSRMTVTPCAAAVSATRSDNSTDTSN